MLNDICYKLAYTNPSTRKHYSCTVVNERLRLHYPLKGVVTALDGTLGIFCFTNLHDLFYFAETMDCTVLKVRGIGEPQYPTKIVPYFYSGYFSKIEELDPELLVPSKKGTVCYKSVEVLEVLQEYSFKNDKF